MLGFRVIDIRSSFNHEWNVKYGRHAHWHPHGTPNQGTHDVCGVLVYTKGGMAYIAYGVCGVLIYTHSIYTTHQGTAYTPHTKWRGHLLQIQQHLVHNLSLLPHSSAATFPRVYLPSPCFPFFYDRINDFEYIAYIAYKCLMWPPPHPPPGARV